MSAPGKWGDPIVPQHGWFCLQVVDLGELGAVCEMCETTDIRYAHHMEYADFPTSSLRLHLRRPHGGRSCRRADLRARRQRGLTGRRERWPRHRSWRRSRRGNDYLNTGRFLVCV
jgi:hypothetical protein